MGAIFGGEKEFTPSFFLDFENVQPSEGETLVYNQVQSVVEKHPKIMEKMLNYRGCTDLIQKAISQPTDENKGACWNTLCPTVDVLKEFFIHAEELVKIFPTLISALCSSPDPETTFSTNQALTKQLASIFDFAMAFDELKMSNPAISNDFSYYRRTMSAFKLNGRDTTKVNITDEMANKMSLFYAFPTPMLNVVKNCISDKIQIDKNLVVGGLSMMANVCINLVDKRRFDNSKILMYCLRAATGATIIVDSLFEPGIFHPKTKKPPISPKYILFVLKGYSEQPTVNLVNALKYNTKEADPKFFDQ
eukprot:TRINITY_DN5624_c0_g1_i7.p1 TRINITY_DN5624_c0_g1~~TRINITY_DN5624_c0_g1_i7.p1  ORF type:complete len:306 (-),score=64.40 TRINITY_DN5624_c0_g1_i7:227-1144(-)